MTRLASMTAAALMLATPAWAGGTILLGRPEMRAGPELRVTSAAFGPGEPIPARYSSYDRNIQPPVAWSSGPPGTKAFAVMIEDPDAPSPTPVVHWLLWDIPASTSGLPEAGKNAAVAGARVGVNSHGTTGYYGPHPPPGDPPHHYHVEVFALDKSLDVAPGQTLDFVAKAMAGHVLAHGELIGTYQKPK